MRPRSNSPGVEQLLARHRLQQSATSRPLKIAIIAHLKHPIAQPYCGGLEMHTHLLARKLIGRGHSVTLFASQGSERFFGATVEVCAPTAGLVGDLERDAERSAYEQIIARISTGAFDIVHNNSLHSGPLLVSGRIPPMLTVLHTPPFEPLAHGAMQAAGACFVAVSPTLARQWSPYVNTSRVVMNGVELDRFAPHGIRIAPPRAIWFGRIVPEKGLHLALDAARAASLPIDFAGPIVDRSYWSDEVAPRCGADVSYLGHLDHATLRWHIARAGVALITPRWDEPFGLVAAEALASGTPVAAFRRGALPDVIGDAGILVTPDDAQELAWAARQALSIDGAYCRHRAETALDCHAMIANYEAIYAELTDCSHTIRAAAG